MPVNRRPLLGLFRFLEIRGRRCGRQRDFWLRGRTFVRGTPLRPKDRPDSPQWPTLRLSGLEVLQYMLFTLRDVKKLLVLRTEGIRVERFPAGYPMLHVPSSSHATDVEGGRCNEMERLTSALAVVRNELRIRKIKCINIYVIYHKTAVSRVRFVIRSHRCAGCMQPDAS